MGQVIFYGFHPAFGRFWHSKYFCIRLIFGIGRATFMVFCRWQLAGKLSVELKILFSLWSSSEGKHGRFRASLIFSTMSSEVYAKVEPCCFLKLCWIFGVCQTKFTALEELLNLLFRDGLFMHNATNFAWLS